jgi:hypothetical protein
MDKDPPPACHPKNDQPSIQRNNDSLYQILMRCLYLLDVRTVTGGHPS